MLNLYLITMNNKTYALIDADIIVHMFCHLIEKHHEGSLRKGTLIIRSYIRNLLSKVKADLFCVFLTKGKGSYRYKLATIRRYKGQRKEKPVLFNDIFRFIERQFPSHVSYDMEADDAMSIVSNHLTKNGNTCYIISSDKDLMQCNSIYFNMRDGLIYDCRNTNNIYLDVSNKLKGVGKALVYAQMLMGDQADNIAGIVGYGPVKTFKTLHGMNLKDMHNKVLSIYKKTYGDKKGFNFFLETKSLLTMLLTSNNFKFPIFKST